MEFNLCGRHNLLLLVGDLLLLLSPEALSTFDTAARIHLGWTRSVKEGGEENQVEQRFVNHASRKAKERS